ncbi:TIGR02587 family membrane protein [Brevundimonas sp.]|uniref:TIGR02587 family membrane protein n=1 Tax=Brevundimonas sp. TaxID=1871086 RepID=UPI00286A9DD4|nr:TIGR02587 family membrane protein [Brevundimonas sp.]
MATATLTHGSYVRGLARAFGGALIFAFPLLMTMEMWSLGVSITPLRLGVFLALSLPLLFGLSYYAGFRETFGWLDDAMDALAALAVGVVTSAVLLALFGVLTPAEPANAMLGQLTLQAVPAAIGALLARRQLASGNDAGTDGSEEENTRETYGSELFLMAVGALFIAFNVAPTEEVVLIAYQMTPWHALGLMILSLGLLHTIVYSLGFAGQHSHEQPWQAFMHFTVPGYLIALLVAVYVQWTFGHMDGQFGAQLAMTTVVLAFPGALGAGAARLLV